MWYTDRDFMATREKMVRWIERRIRLPVAGLDISDRSVKYAQFRTLRSAARGARHTRAATLACFGEEEIPEGVIVSGVVEKGDVFTAVLRKIGEKAGRAFRASGMVVSLPEEKSFLRVFQLPKVIQGEIAGAIRWKIEEEIPLPSEDVIYDYEAVQPIRDNLDHRDVLVTAFPKSLVASYVRAVKDAGLTPVALELESQAIVRATAPDLHAAEANVVIDMGRTRASFILFVGGAIIFTTTVPVGGHMFDIDIARALGIDEQEAARIKEESGLAKDAYDGKVYAALAPSVETLARELRRVIGYHRDHAMHIHGGSPSVQKIFLSGGEANLLGLDTYLASAMRIPVVPADPFVALRDTLSGPVPPLPHAAALAFTAAVGLALRGARGET